MRATSSLVTFNQKIMLRCKKLLIKITSSCPKRHYRHLKLEKSSSTSSSSPSSSGRKTTRVMASFFLSFQKKKQKKEKKKQSFSGSVSERTASNPPKSRKKVFPSRLAPSCLGQGKARSQKVSQDLDAPRDSTSSFLPWSKKSNHASSIPYVLLISFIMWMLQETESLRMYLWMQSNFFAVRKSLVRSMCVYDSRTQKKYSSKKKLWIRIIKYHSSRIQIISKKEEKIDIKLFIHLSYKHGPTASFPTPNLEAYTYQPGECPWISSR